MNLKKITGTCRIEGCRKPTHGGDLCDMHYQRKRRGQSMTAEPLPASPRQRLIHAAIEFADADAENDAAYAAALEKLEEAAVKLAEAKARAKANGEKSHATMQKARLAKLDAARKAAV